MVFTWTTSVFKDGLHTVRNIFLTKVDRSFPQALLFLWTSDFHCFSLLFLFLCTLSFHRSIIPKCITPKSGRMIWWVQHSSPQHLNPLYLSMKMSRSFTQGKSIIKCSVAEKTVLPCAATHSKKVRGKNKKNNFPFYFLKDKIVATRCICRSGEGAFHKKKQSGTFTAGHPGQNYLDENAPLYCHLLNKQKVRSVHLCVPFMSELLKQLSIPSCLPD